MSFTFLSLIAFASLTHLCGCCGRVCEISHISVDLCISLSTFDVHTFLLCKFLVPRPLPFRQPSLWIRERAWVFRIITLREFCFMLSFLWNVDLSTTTQLFQANVLRLLVLFPLWHAFFNQLLDQLVLILTLFDELRLWQGLIQFFCLFKINISQNC